MEPKSYRGLKAKEKSTAIRGDLDTALQTLAAATESAAEQEIFRSWIASMATFHRYSFRNCMLIAWQRPNATVCAGKTDWWTRGYKLRKGATFIWILAPLVRKVEGPNGTETATTVYGFRTVPTIAYEDVEPRDDQKWLDSGKTPTPVELPYRAEGDADELLQRLEAFAAHKGIAVESIPVDELGSSKGSSCGGRIRLREDLTGAARAGTLAHELGHELLHWSEGKLDRDHQQSHREVEAESVSYAILNTHGIHQDSHFYLRSWGGTRTLVEESMARIRRAVHEILDFIEQTPVAA